MLKYKLAQQDPELKVIFATWGVRQLEILDELQQRFQLEALVNNLHASALSKRAFDD